jgi:hypothetical protein
VDEELWREPVERDAVVLEFVASGLEVVLLVGDGVEESPKLGPATLEDVDLANEQCGVLVDELTLVGHIWFWAQVGHGRKKVKSGEWGADRL